MSLLTRFALSALVAVGFATAHAAPIVGQGTWETTLQARDIHGNAVDQDSASAAFFYDTTLNVTYVTWLANMNQNGKMNWGNAMAWANGLTTGGFSDWRLPTIIDSGTPGCNQNYDGGTDCGFTVQTQVNGAYSEWAHFYYVTLGNLAYCTPSGGAPNNSCEGPQSGWGPMNTAYFQNVQFQNMASDNYWSGTKWTINCRQYGYVCPPGFDGYPWGFNTYYGYQGFYNGSDGLYAVAVRSGDVLRDGGGTVPEPHGLVLALTALAGLGVALRRRRAA